MNNYSKKTLNSYRDKDKWIKIVTKTNFDSNEYNNFYNYCGYQFLPKLYNYEKFDNFDKLTMEFIEGETLTNNNINSFIRYLSYKIILSFLEWTKIKKYENSIFFHVDLKIENFLITENKKLFLIDIDSLLFTSYDFFDVILNEIYRKDQKFIKNP